MATKPSSSQVSFTATGSITATDLQTALAEVSTDASNEIAAAVATSNSALASFAGATSVGFTPVATVTSTSVQAAIAEVASDAATALSDVVTGLGDSTGSSLVGFIQAGTGAVATTVQSKLRESISVKDFGAVGDGVADDTAAFALTRAVTNRYHIPSGTYVLDASPDPFLDCFTSGNGVTLVVGGVSYDCSNAFAGPWRWVAASAQKLNVVHAKTGNVVQYWQDGSPGTATGFYRGLAFMTDSHWVQVQPATNGGSTDILWQRSTLNADPAGNRFNETFEEANDRLIFSYATSASGPPAFDSFMQCYAGTSPSLQFPALIAQFQKGISVKQRSAGGYEFTIEPTSSTQATLKELGGAGTTYMTFRTGAFGFFGSTGTSQQTVTGSRGGNAALASLITALANTGLIIDGTTS